MGLIVRCHGYFVRAYDTSEESAGPPPNSLSPEVSMAGVLASALWTPTIRGQGSPSHQPQTGPPE
jgi:hypothetical protein